jgi:hypothetical protein
MAILLVARRLTRSEIKSVLFVSICDTPQWGTRIVSTLSCTVLTLLFRPLIIVNASQIAAGCRAATVLRPLLQHSHSLFANAEDASEATEDLIESCDQSPTMVSVIGSLGRCTVPQATLRMPW